MATTNLSRWDATADPASEIALKQLTEWSDVPLPLELLDLLRVTNGGEVALPISPWRFLLWSAEDIPKHNAGYETAKWFPGYVGFGSNGAGEMFAFCEGAGSEIFAIPFCDSDPNDIIVVAENFSVFVEAMGAPNK